MSVFENRNLDDTFFYRLKPGEEVLWSYENAAGPIASQYAAWAGLLSIPVTLIWIAFFLAPIWMLAIPLAIPGSIGAAWHFFRRNRFAYAVTNQRVFVMNSLSPICLNIFTPEMLQGVVSFEKPTKGTGGTVVLDQSPFWLWDPFQQNPPRLSNIPDPHKVRALIEARVLNSVPERTAA